MADGGWLPVAGSIVAAAIPVFGVWIKEAVGKRSVEHSRSRVLTQVKEEIAVAESWAKAHATLEPDAAFLANVRARARSNLDLAYAKLDAEPTNERRSVSARHIAAVLFVRHFPVTGWVRGVRALYYIALLMLFVWGFTAVSTLPSPVTASAIAISISTYLFVGIGPAWFFGWLTNVLGRRQAARRSTPGQSPPTRHGGPATATSPAWPQTPRARHSGQPGA